MKVVPLRLLPGADLRRALEAWMGEQQEQAGCVLSAVGSLSVVQLRFAGAAEATAICGELEILSLSGTLSPDGAHLHIAVADSRGVVICSSTDTILAPMRRPRSRKRPSFSSVSRFTDILRQFKLRGHVNVGK